MKKGMEIVVHLNHLRLYFFWKCSILPNKVFYMVLPSADKIKIGRVVVLTRTPFLSKNY